MNVLYQGRLGNFINTTFINTVFDKAFDVDKLLYRRC